MMILRGEPLQDAAYTAIEQRAGTQALRHLQEVLPTMEDKELRGHLEDAAFAYAYAMSDAALMVGWQMAQDPGKWLFTLEE